MMKFKEVWDFCCLRFSREYDLLLVSQPIYVLLRNLTQLIDKKFKRCPGTMNESLIYINTNVEFV